MYEKLGMKKLKNGEELEAGVVTGPDPEWSERLVAFLEHKGEHWVSQIRATLEEDLSPLETRFFILFAGPENIYSNVCTFLSGRVANLGHVFTAPEHRRKGAAGILMKASVDDFRKQGGKAMYLTAAYDAQAFHIYKSFGFECVYPKTGFMEYYTVKRDDFLAEHFAAQETHSAEMAWHHWPELTALFGQEEGGVLRLPGEAINGRADLESPYAQLRYSMEASGKMGFVLEGKKTGCVAGAAVIGPDRRLAGSTRILDFFFHPNFTGSASALVNKAIEGIHDKVISYVDSSCDERMAALARVGFKEEGRIRDAVVSPFGMPDAGAGYDLVLMTKN